MRIGSLPVNRVYRGAQNVTGARRGQDEVSFFDPSSAEFFSRAGVFNLTEKIKIDQFVKYCKANELWNNLYCFPLILNQNPNRKPLGGLVDTTATSDGIMEVAGLTSVGLLGPGTFTIPESRSAQFASAFGFSMLAAAKVNTYSVPDRGAIIGIGTSLQGGSAGSWKIEQTANSAGVVEVRKADNRIPSGQYILYASYTNTTWNFLYNLSVNYPFSPTQAAFSSGGSRDTATTSSLPQSIGGNLTTFRLGYDQPGPSQTASSFNGTISFAGIILNKYFNSSSEANNFQLNLKNSLLNGFLQ